MTIDRDGLLWLGMFKGDSVVAIDPKYVLSLLFLFNFVSLVKFQLNAIRKGSIELSEILRFPLIKLQLPSSVDQI